MSEGFDYVMSMRDQMSGPASAIKGAMSGLRASILEVKEAQLKADMAGNTASMKAAATEAKRLGLEYAHMAEELKHVSEAERERKRHESEQKKADKESFLGQLKSSMIPNIALGELLAEGIKRIGEVAEESAKQVAELVIETTKFAVEASEFKEATQGAYEAILGTAEAGAATYQEIEELSASMHMPTEKAQGIATALMEQGLENVNLVKGAIASISNLERAGLGAAAEKFKSVIERSLSAGHFVLPKKLTGIQQESVYAELAKSLGESVEQVKAQMKAGKIATEDGVAALETVVNSSKIAEVARKKFTIEDAVTDLRNSWRSMLEDVDASPLTDAFRDFVSIFADGSSSAGAMKDVMTQGINEIIKWVAQGIESTTIFLLQVENFGLRTEIGLYPAIKAFKDLYDRSSDLGPSLIPVKVVFTEMAREIIGAANAVAKLIDAYNSLPSWARMGGDGLGGTGGKREGNALTADDVTSGFGGGMGKTVAPAHASGGMVMQPAPGEAFASVAPGELILPREFMSKLPDFGTPAANGNGGTVVHVDVGGIEIHGATDIATMRPMLESEVADVFERVRLELGA